MLANKLFNKNRYNKHRRTRYIFFKVVKVNKALSMTGMGDAICNAKLFGCHFERIKYL